MNFIILSSSRGTTMQAVMEAVDDGSLTMECLGLVSDKEDRECVVFFDNGASGLADVILDLYKNAAKIDRICLAAKQKVLVDHSVTAVKEALQTVF